ncbi:unnamed protein product [Rotaria magnacalcarata]|uniref:Glycosyltransferase n=3 Tax=Rotaria magnacalcarata TaxID=392030 RepID=A0A815K8H6_9BILA|nr:unnamed protein product [Rotaria magnacalcarata]CAF4502739.1 unnamed protein product [Rotaria magnacalcarata]
MDSLSVQNKISECQELHEHHSSLTVLFFPFAAYGPINQCIAMGDVLRRHGHRVVIAVDRMWQEKLTSLGFEVYLTDLGDPTIQNPGEYWANIARDTLSKVRQPTIMQLEALVNPAIHAVIEETKRYQQQMRLILDQVQPNVVIQDNAACLPILLTNGVPFVRVVSCNPLEIPGPNVPPTFSGLPQDDHSEWDRFRNEYERVIRPMWEDFNSWVQQHGLPPLTDLQFNCESKYANIYIYPQEADYTENRPLGPTWHRIDSSVRETDCHFELPISLRERPEGSCLVYVSLGTLVSADVELLQHLIDVLSRTVHRFIFSKGLYGDQLKLPNTMYGEANLPQTKVLPLVDLVITHGGNNTVTESLHFGKPMILLPICWDQHDNAQRMHEKGFGVRLDTYQFTDEDLLVAVDTLLKDTALRDRMALLGEQIRGRDGVRLAADIIERVGYENLI